MKKQIIAAMLVLASALAFGQKAADDFSGKWKTPEGKIILISRSGKMFGGTTQEGGQKIIENVLFADGHWQGTILKPGTSTRAKCELILDGDKLTITARKGIFSKTIVWTKL